MFIFLYGEDSYRARLNLNEIIAHYQKVHKSGLNLKYFDFKKDTYQNFETELKNYPMFAGKKLLVLKNVSFSESFKINFLKSAKKFLNLKDIILFFEGEISEKDKFFKFIKKSGKFKRFQPLEGERLKHWARQEFNKERIKIEPEALNQLIHYAGNNLWRLSGEIKKLTSYKIKESAPAVKKEDVDLLVRPKIEADIFKTIDAISLKNKKQALSLIHRHVEKGDSPLYLLSMINFQFRNLLLIKTRYQSTNDIRMSRMGNLSRELGMHPYVVRKATELASRFSFEELQKIYQKIFQVDFAIKTGRVDPVAALDLFIAEI